MCVRACGHERGAMLNPLPSNVHLSWLALAQIVAAGRWGWCGGPLGACSEAKQVELENGERPAASMVGRGAVKPLSSSWLGQLARAVMAEVQPRPRVSWTSRPDRAGEVERAGASTVYVT